MEIRTLEIVREQDLDNPFSADQFRDRNILLVKSSGAVTIHIQVYKTRRFTGHEQVDLQVGPVIVGLVIAVDCRPTLHVKVAGIPFRSRLNSFSWLPGIFNS